MPQTGQLFPGFQQLPTQFDHLQVRLSCGGLGRSRALACGRPRRVRRRDGRLCGGSSTIAGVRCVLVRLRKLRLRAQGARYPKGVAGFAAFLA
eukprot:310293-Chlamydomonas_euryale.AAC.1